MAKLSTVLVRAARAAFRAAGDLAVIVTWRQLKPGAYDVATGVASLPAVDVHPKAIVEALTHGQAENAGVSDKALRLIIIAADLAGVEPREGDQVLVGSKTYTVKRIQWQGQPAIIQAVVDL